MALVWFLVSYIPGGASGLKLMAKLFSRLFTSTNIISNGRLAHINIIVVIIQRMLKYDLGGRRR